MNRAALLSPEQRALPLTALVLLSLGQIFADESLVIDDSFNQASKVVFEPKVVLEQNIASPRLQLAFDTDARYDSNILLDRNGFEQEGFTYTASPSVLYRILGDDFTEHLIAVGYSPTAYYEDFSRDLRVNHDVDLIYRWQTGRTTVALAGDYQHVEGNSGRDFSRQGESLQLREQRRARSDRFGLRLDIDYEVSSVLDARLNAGYRSAEFDVLNDYSSYGVEFALLYGGDEAITRIGPYIGYERVDADLHPTQDAFQAGARVEWEYSALTTFFGQVGVDTREFSGTNALGGSREEVVWALGMRWHPDDMLHVDLAFDRSVNPSISQAAQNFTVSTFSAAVRKEFLLHYFGRLVGAYSWSDYEATLAGQTVMREDDYFSAFFELGRDLSDYGEISIFYNFLENDSTVNALSFDNHTVGVKLGVDF